MTKSGGFLRAASVFILWAAGLFIPDSFPALDLEHFDCKTDSVGKLGVIDDFFNFLFRKILKLSEKDLI